MKRQQRKSLSLRRFGYVILIVIKFGELLLWISLRIINVLRNYIKHDEECFIRYPNTSKLVKKTRLRLVFSNHFSLFGYLMKHSSSCLIYYNKIIHGYFEIWNFSWSVQLDISLVRYLYVVRHALSLLTLCYFVIFCVLFLNQSPLPFIYLLRKSRCLCFIFVLPPSPVLG